MLKFATLFLLIFFTTNPINRDTIAHAEEKKIEYIPPEGKDQHPNQRRKAGGTREEFCRLPLNDTITLLVPQNHIPITVSERPTFFGYVPKGITFPLRFTLVESSGQTVFVKKSIPPIAGIKTLKLPQESPSLKVGKTYRWTITVVCSQNKPSRNVYASALIKRINAIDDQSMNETSLDFAKRGIWYDALQSSYLQSQEIGDFQSLIKQVNLDSLITNDRL